MFIVCYSPAGHRTWRICAPLAHAWNCHGDHPLLWLVGSPQRLRERVHLVVVASGRKGQEFLLEVLQPRRALREPHGAGLDAGKLSVHAHDLVPFRIDGDSVDVLSPDVLDKAHAGALVLDQQRVVSDDPSLQPTWLRSERSSAFMKD